MMSLSYCKIVNNPLTSNCFILFDKEYNNNCIIVDPGSENCDEIDEFLSENNLFPEIIFLTHEHFDHVWSCNYLYDKYLVKLICSVKCAEAIKSSKMNHSLFYNQVGFTVNIDAITIEELDYNLMWNNSAVHFFNSAGHTKASICIIIGNYIITGDTLIKNIKTVTKLFCGSKDDLVQSINIIATYKGNRLTVLPGHGDVFELDNYDLKKAL